jgi:hypothetical protein
MSSWWWAVERSRCLACFLVSGFEDEAADLEDALRSRVEERRDLEDASSAAVAGTSDCSAPRSEIEVGAAGEEEEATTPDPRAAAADSDLPARSKILMVPSLKPAMTKRPEGAVERDVHSLFAWKVVVISLLLLLFESCELEGFEVVVGVSVDSGSGSLLPATSPGRKGRAGVGGLSTVYREWSFCNNGGGKRSGRDDELAGQ